jgi:hypothetical protein
VAVELPTYGCGNRTGLATIILVAMIGRVFTTFRVLFALRVTRARRAAAHRAIR